MEAQPDVHVLSDDAGTAPNDSLGWSDSKQRPARAKYRARERINPFASPEPITPLLSRKQVEEDQRGRKRNKVWRKVVEPGCAHSQLVQRTTVTARTAGRWQPAITSASKQASPKSSSKGGRGGGGVGADGGASTRSSSTCDRWTSGGASTSASNTCGSCTRGSCTRGSCTCDSWTSGSSFSAAAH